MSKFDNSKSFAVRTLLAIGLSVAFSTAALAAGSQSDETQPPEKTKTTTECKNGQVWDKVKEKCVDAKKSSLDDDTLYTAARELAYDGQYDNAITLLNLISNQNDPKVLNYLGYANRKAGRFDVGMKYYQQALAIDANFILTRSYMGQALLEQGNVQAARTQLIEIRDRGGENTWAYRALEQALGGTRTY
jgi:tetratricopeptide (TPR) repeat protein